MSLLSEIPRELKDLTYNIVFEESREPKFLIDRDGIILNANRVFSEHTGKQIRDCIGLNIYSLVTEEVAAERKKYVEEAFLTGTRQIFEIENNGRCLRLSLYPIEGKSGEIDKLYVFAQDITEIKLAEKKTFRHSAFSKEAMEAFPGSYTILDIRGAVISCNSYFRNAVAGKSDDDLSGIDTFSLFHPDDKPLAFAKLNDILQNGTEESAELRVLIHGGPEYRWFRISTKRIIVDNEIFLVSAGTDIDEYKKKEQELSMSNEQLRFILSESRTGSWDWDMTTNINKWSDEIWDLYGLDRFSGEPSYETWIKAVIEEDRERIEQEVSEASVKGIPFRIEWRVHHNNGTLRWLMSRGIPFRGSDGNVSRYAGIVIDITDLKESEQKQKESEERFRKLFEQHSAVMMILDPETGNIVDVNHAATKYYGWNKEQLIRMSVMELNIEKHEKIRKILDGWKNADKRIFTVMHRIADGAIHDIEIFGQKIKVQDKWLAFLILHDITERKQYQQALIESNERMHFILSAANAGIWETFLGTNVSNWSEEIWRLYDLNTDSFAASLENWLNTIIAEDRAPVEQAVAEAVSNGTEFNSTWRIRDSKGNLRWLLSKGNPVRDADGRIVKYVGITLDISERKRIEEENRDLESRIQKSQRLETIGTLAGGIAHDFNNILTPILGFAEMGIMKVPDKDPVREYFREIMLAAERARNLVSQILTFGKARESKPVIVCVQSIVEEALKLLRPSIPSTIRIEQQIDPFCRNILADTSKIHQVIVNLCTNAIQAMENREGTLSIKLEEVVPDRNLLKILPELNDVPYVRLTISDTGEGMDKATIDHIFEPFFTTKTVNRGTGLGLSVVHGIITGYKGVINVESQPGKGNSFHIFLPLVNRKIADMHQKNVVSGGNASILFIDDEETPLKIITILLTELGHRVRAMNSPRKAIELFRQSPGAFDLVITDLTMPEMTGLDLASEIHACRPDIPVFMMTGYGKNHDDVREQEKYGIRLLLKKPVRAEILVSAINEVLFQ